MQTKHTPGPWRVGMKPGPIIYGTRGEQVADLTAQFVPDDETRGNVRLITAAPDLLAALRIAETALEAYSGGESSDLATIRAAIHKATG